jgi:hypothetical protein
MRMRSFLKGIIALMILAALSAGAALADPNVPTLEGQWAVTIRRDLSTTNDVWTISRNGDGYVIDSKMEGRVPILQIRENPDGLELELEPTAWERSALNVIRKYCRLAWQDDRTVEGYRVSIWRLQGVMDGNLNETIRMQKILSDLDMRQAARTEGTPVQIRLDGNSLRAYSHRLTQLRENLRNGLERENATLKQRAELFSRQGDQRSALGDSASGNAMKMANYGAAQGYYRNAALLGERISRNLTVMQLLKNPLPPGDTPQQLLNNFDGIWLQENEANYTLNKWKILVSGANLKIFAAPLRTETDVATDYLTNGAAADVFEAVNIANLSLNGDGSLSFTMTWRNETRNVTCYLIQPNLAYGSMTAGNSRSNLRLVKIGRNAAPN